MRAWGCSAARQCAWFPVAWRSGGLARSARAWQVVTRWLPLVFAPLRCMVMATATASVVQIHLDVHEGGSGLGGGGGGDAADGSHAENAGSPEAAAAAVAVVAASW